MTIGFHHEREANRCKFTPSIKACEISKEAVPIGRTIFPFEEASLLDVLDAQRTLWQTVHFMCHVEKPPPPVCLDV